MSAQSLEFTSSHLFQGVTCNTETLVPRLCHCDRSKQHLAFDNMDEAFTVKDGKIVIAAFRTRIDKSKYIYVRRADNNDSIGDETELQESPYFAKKETDNQ